MKSALLKIEGMHCNGCAQTIKALLSAEPGVRAVDVSFKDREARILYEPHTLGEDQLVSVIERAGYRASAPRR